MIMPTRRREQSFDHIKTPWVHIKVHIYSEMATEIWQKFPDDLAFFLVRDISSYLCGLYELCMYITSMIVYAPHGI
jgi:hypothetical protein